LGGLDKRNDSCTHLCVEATTVRLEKPTYTSTHSAKYYYQHVRKTPLEASPKSYRNESKSIPEDELNYTGKG